MPVTDLFMHDLGKQPPIDSYDDLLSSARELTDGVIDILQNECYQFHLAYEDWSPEEEKRIKGIIGNYLQKQILERF